MRWAMHIGIRKTGSKAIQRFLANEVLGTRGQARLSRSQGSRVKHASCAQPESRESCAEQTLSVARRAQLETALDFIRGGDVFVGTKIDRLARSVAELCGIGKRIESQGATLRILAISTRQRLQASSC